MNSYAKKVVRTMKKIIMILTISTILLNVLFITVFAFNTGVFDISGMGMDPDVAVIGGKIIYVFQRVGTYFAVGVLAFIGIQYMLASPSEKADIKGRAVPYLVGAIMVLQLHAESSYL